MDPRDPSIVVAENNAQKALDENNRKALSEALADTYNTGTTQMVSAQILVGENNGEPQYAEGEAREMPIYEKSISINFIKDLLQTAIQKRKLGCAADCLKELNNRQNYLDAALTEQVFNIIRATQRDPSAKSERDELFNQLKAQADKSPVVENTWYELEDKRKVNSKIESSTQQDAVKIKAKHDDLQIQISRLLRMNVPSNPKTENEKIFSTLVLNLTKILQSSNTNSIAKTLQMSALMIKAYNDIADNVNKTTFAKTSENATNIKKALDILKENKIIGLTSASSSKKMAHLNDVKTLETKIDEGVYNKHKDYLTSLPAPKKTQRTPAEGGLFAHKEEELRKAQEEREKAARIEAERQEKLDISRKDPNQGL
jgi:hypothetical protein